MCLDYKKWIIAWTHARVKVARANIKVAIIFGDIVDFSTEGVAVNGLPASTLIVLLQDL